MHVARDQRIGDLGCRQQAHVDVGETRERGAVAARTRRLLHGKARIGEIALHLLLQAALRRHGEDEGRAHFAPCFAPGFALWAARAASTRSVRMTNPMAGMARLAPSCSSSVS